MLDQAYKHRRLAVPKQPKDRRAFQRRTRAGEIVMPHKGMYINAQKWESLSYSERIIWTNRTVCHEHPDWVLCGPSAAGSLGFTTTIKLQRYVHIAVADRSKAGRHGYAIAHYYKDFPSTTIVDDMRVTSGIETMADCARMLDMENAMSTCCTALRQTGMPKERFQDYVNRKKRIGGIIRARYIAEHVEPACENGGEAVALATMLELGFAQPQMQVSFASPLDGRDIRADYLWTRDDGSIVVGELDGRQKYIDPSMLNNGDAVDAILREKDRETELNMLQISVVRFQMEHVRDREQLRKRLAAAEVPRDAHAYSSPFKGFVCKTY